MSVAMGGDETGGFVGDVGTAVSKFGFGGEDAPKGVLSSRLGCVFDQNQAYVKGSNGVPLLRELTAEDYRVPDDYPARLHTRSPFVAPPQNQQCVAKWLHGDVSSLGAARFDKGESCVVRSPLVDGELDDWDTIEELWREAFERAKTSGEEQPVLAATPSDASPKHRAQYLELLFETFGCRAAYLARNATLAAFAAGRASGLVVDCGAGTTSVVPVVDGYVLMKGIRTSKRGGDHVDAHAHDLLTKLCGGTEPVPRAAVRREGRKTYESWPEAFRKFTQRETVRDLKESYGVIPKKWGLAVGLKEDKRQFFLPDGTVVDVTTDLVRAPEQLFEGVEEDEVVKKEDEEPSIKVVRDARVGQRALQPPQIMPPINDPVVAALPEMVKGSLERVDVDVRKDLLLNIVLSGGGSCAPGTAERLHSDVALSLCAPFKAKIVAPAAFERKFGVWIGGSILSSLGSFQQMWLSKKEYDDDGPTRLVEGRWD